MGKKKKTKKLALKKETVRKLDALNEAELKDAAGGAYLVGTAACFGPTAVCIRTTTYTCGCNPDGTTGYMGGTGGYC